MKLINRRNAQNDKISSNRYIMTTWRGGYTEVSRSLAKKDLLNFSQINTIGSPIDRATSVIATICFNGGDAKMLTIEQAFEKIADYAVSKCGVLGIKAPKTERLPLSACLGRILGEDLVAPIDVPPFPNSAMDGFALDTRSLKHAQAVGEGWVLPVRGRVAAGDSVSTMPQGCAVQIFTGAPIPRGADAVVIMEDCVFDTAQQQVLIKVLPQPNAHIRPQGQDLREGVGVFSTGRQLFAQDLGLCAALGLGELSVQQPVRVALLNTGNELVAPGKPLAPGQIYNSNGVMLQAMLSQMGAEVVQVFHVPDSLTETQSALLAASAQADLILCTGGVSVGDEDHVKAALSTVGEIAFWKVAMKPGKPLAVGTVEKALFMGLPGNPVSAFVTGQLFLPILLQALRGLSAQAPQMFKVPATFSINEPHARSQWLRTVLTPEGAVAFPNQSSGVLQSVCWGDALCLVPAKTVIAPGDLVDVYTYPSDLSASRQLHPD